ncbi:MAG TPA: hypothetical protein VMV92_18835 [Streptosporangiaceae bacterium]|nr:hypothetical protein [Streptosporangiaceae bacterium]
MSITEISEIYLAPSASTALSLPEPELDVQASRDPEQVWFWTPEWQTGEQEATAEIIRGDLSPVFESADEMFEYLDDQA